MRKLINTKWAILALGLFPAMVIKAAIYTVTSPGGSLKLNADVSTIIRYDVTYNGNQVIAPSAISLSMSNGLIIGQNGVIKDTQERTADESIISPFGKNPVIKDNYNELRINFTENYSLIFRAYDEGVAYRFETNFGEPVIVNSEEANFNFPGTPGVIFPEADANMQSWERSYTRYTSINDIATSKFCITPALFQNQGTGVNLVIAESDLTDYPGMYLQRNEVNGMKGMWAHYPKTVTEPDNVYAYHRVTERYDYLAMTQGIRSYPWRVIIVSKEDKELLNNELIFKLARPQAFDNTSWIKPGKSTWEWWHDAILEGVSIPSGFNNLGLQLYKYYIDFAAENKIEYLTMDAGWGADYVAQVCSYAASRNVKVFLWDYVNLAVENPDRLTTLKNYGAAGVKIDLIERDDQVAINWIEKLAKDCADRQLMVIFHGVPKPTGLQRMYPNIINFEAVRGEECDKWDNSSNSDYHLLFPFIRMLAGPVEYTPGSMRNVHLEQFIPVAHGIPNSIGTRSHELAMYVIFDQPLAYLDDSPPAYRKYPDNLSFLSRVPTLWDQTLPLSAKIGEYIVTARKKGEEWYVGAMTNSIGRNIDIDFSFLSDTIAWKAEIYRDNDLSVTDAKAYAHEIINVQNTSRLTFKLSPEGGLAMRIYKAPATGINENNNETIKIHHDTHFNELIIQSPVKIRSVSIVDLLGRIRYQNNSISLTPLYNINIAGLNEGLYIVRLYTGDNGFQSYRFVKF